MGMITGLGTTRETGLHSEWSGEPGGVRYSESADVSRFCDSSSRSCCWCSRFLIKNIFGMVSTAANARRTAQYHNSEPAKVRQFTFTQRATGKVIQGRQSERN